MGLGSLPEHRVSGHFYNLSGQVGLAVIQIQRFWFVMLCLAAFGCGSSTSPSGRDSVTITGATPATGSNITLPAQFFNTQGAAIVPRGSGFFSVTVNLGAAHDIPWSQLNVYLLTGGTNDQYCGQNLPDSPTWQFLTPGWKTSVTVSGFQVRVPCDVTGFRAMWHMRNNGNAQPPSASETIADNSFPATLHLLR